MRRRMLPALAVCVVALALVVPASSDADGPTAAAPPSLRVLLPGGIGILFAPLPVNIVFVGYAPGDGAREIDVARPRQHGPLDDHRLRERGSADARAEDAAVVSADQSALRALIAYQQMDYQAAASWAQDAYDGLVAAAGRLHVPVEPEAVPADAKARSPGRFFVDPVNPYTGLRRETGPIAFDAPATLPDEPLGWYYPRS